MAAAAMNPLGSQSYQRVSFGAARGDSNAQPLVLECGHKQSRLAAADHDNDGDVDFLVTTNCGPVLLLRNEGGNRNHWLKLRLRGVESNRQDIGTKVWITAGEFQLYREVGTSSSYLSQNFSELQVGLGIHKAIDRLELLWPSGMRQVFENLPADRLLEVVENGPDAGLKPLAIHACR